MTIPPESIKLPTIEDYQSAIEHIDSRIADLFDYDSNAAITQYKERLKTSESFYSLMTMIGKSALYLEAYDIDGQLIDEEIPTAKAFAKGAIFAEMINDRLFERRNRNEGYKWLNNKHLYDALSNDEYDLLPANTVMRLQFQRSSNVMLSALQDESLTTIKVVAGKAVPHIENAPDFTLGCGLQLAAEYGYRENLLRANNSF